MFEQIAAMTIFDILGLAGVVFYLGSYAALQLDLINGKGFTYPMLNFIAASCVLFSLFENFNMPSLLIQVSWIAISLYGITKIALLQAPSESDPA